MKHRLIVMALATLISACSNADPGSAAVVSTPAAPEREGSLLVETVAAPLSHPWGLAFLPEGGFLVTEREGNLRRISPDGVISAPLLGVPDVVAEGQGGLLDIALSPTFAQDRLVYFSYAEAGEGDLAGVAVARARLQAEALQDVQVLFRQLPKFDTRQHFGSRLVFDGQGHLFITLGDRGIRENGQRLDQHTGSVIRIHVDGSVPADNPYVGHEGVRPEIWSHGHRNQQGAAWNPWRNELWTNEHGPRGGDEINIPQAGKNYGWPIITWGINYSGLRIPESEGTEKPGMEQPIHYWEVSPALSGMAFYDHARFSQWQGNVFIGALAGQALLRLSLDGTRVVAEERLLNDRGWRIRDVRVGPDGAVYVLTDEDQGRLLRLTLATAPSS